MKMDNYIPHDVNMRNYCEVIDLIEHENASGYGLYWTILEYLRTQDNYRGDIRALRGIARQLKSRMDKALRILNNYGLFVVEGNTFYSPLLLEKMEPLEQKRAQRKALRKSKNMPQSVHTPSQNETGLSQNETTLFQSSSNPLIISSCSDKEKIRKRKVSSSSIEKGDDVVPVPTTLAWERYVDGLRHEQQWIEIMAMRSGMGKLFVQRFSEVLEHFKLHVQAVGNEKDILSPSDAKRYFCFYNTPGSAPFRKLVEHLKQSVSVDPYRFEHRDPQTGKRSYCGVPIPEDAPPRPNDQAAWCEGKWVF